MRYFYLFLMGILLPTFSISQCDPGNTAVTFLRADQRWHAVMNGTMLSSFQGNPGFVVGGTNPDGKSLVYSAGQWIAGFTPDSQLKLAASTYADQGTDFYPGIGGATPGELASGSCEDLDQFFFVTRAFVERHKLYFDCLQDPNCDTQELFPLGYEIPEQLYLYPAQYVDNDGFMHDLAPFVDADLDGTYNPENGDCPDFDSEDCCRALRGDVAMLSFTNDFAGLHMESNGDAYGLELRNMAYWYYGEGFENARFHRTEWINHGTQTILENHLGHFMDADVGNPQDDTFGFLPEENLMFVYNADGFDEDYTFPLAPAGWEGQPPVVGLALLQGPPMDDDGLDNDDDGIVDNETLGFATGLGNDPLTAFPNTPFDYYTWMNGSYIDGSPFQDNGDFVYFQHEGIPSGDEGYLPQDARVLASTDLFSIEPGDAFCTQTVITYHQGAIDEGPLGGLTPLLEDVDVMQEAFDNCFDCVPPAAHILVEPMESGWNLLNISAADEYNWDFGDLGTSTDPFPAIALDEGQALTVTLTVSNECGSATTTIEFEDVALSIEETTERSISLYPNPVSNTLNAEVSDALIGETAKIYNLVGKRLSTHVINSSTERIDVSNLETGVYFLSIPLEKGRRKTIKFVKAE